jgi:hypothetical protein
VKQLDDEKHFERQQNIKAVEQSAAANRAVSRVAATSQNSSHNTTLSGPSHKVNTASTPATVASKTDYPPKLTDEEKTLLLKYDGCLKCRKPFVFHKGSDRAPGCTFPVETGYTPLTFSTITASMPTNYKAKVAVIVPAAMNTGPAFAGHPAAAVFPGVSNPVDYVASNASNMIDGTDDNDSSVSVRSSPLTISSVVDSVGAAAPINTRVFEGTVAPFSVPHMF